MRELLVRTDLAHEPHASLGQLEAPAPRLDGLTPLLRAVVVLVCMGGEDPTLVGRLLVYLHSRRPAPMRRAGLWRYKNAHLVVLNLIDDAAAYLAPQPLPRRFPWARHAHLAIPTHRRRWALFLKASGAFNPPYRDSSYTPYRILRCHKSRLYRLVQIAMRDLKAYDTRRQRTRDLRSCSSLAPQPQPLEEP